MADHEREPEREGYVHAGSIIVDSGALLVCDPSNFLRQETGGDSADKPSFEETHARLDGSLGGAFGEGLGFICRSGYGDGTYPVFAKINEDRRVVEVVIDMQMTDWQKALFEAKKD